MGHALGTRTIMLGTRGLLCLSDDELQLVHEAIPGDALWSCVRCCKRLRTAALASGGLALAAAIGGYLASVKLARLVRECALSRDLCAGKLGYITAAQACHLRMLRWALANGGVGLHGDVVMELAIAAGNLSMVRVAHEHGCVYGRDYETAAITDHLAIVQWLYERDSECSEQLRQSRMTSAAGCAAAHGKLQVLKWVTDEQDERHNNLFGRTFLSRSERIAASRPPPEVPAYWGRYILAAAARGGHSHVIRWAHRAGCTEEETEEEWTQAVKLARAAAKIVYQRECTEKLQRQRAGQQRAPSKMLEAGMFDETHQWLFEEANAVNKLIASSATLLRGPRTAHEHA